jgi:ABC-2 type transport system ATP-binding protein
MDLNLEKNLIFAGRYFGLSKGEIKDRKDYLLEKFELKEYAKKELKILSGGYRQRFMIARSVMHRPKIVILDEPTVGLDPKLRRKLWRYILSLKDEGVTILLTTHYLEEADILSNRVCVIDEGEIKIIETPSNLKKQWKKKNLEDVFLHLIQERESDEK